MAQTWIEKVSVAATRTAWGIPEAQVTELGTLYGAALVIFQEIRNKGERTEVMTAQCNAAFGALKRKMRFFKNHYFLVPPLTEPDLVSLGLRPRKEHSNIPPPDGFAEADVSYPGVGVLELHPHPVAGQPPLDPRSEYGYRVYWGVYPPGGATAEMATGRKRELMNVPLTGDDLPHSMWLRRRRERLIFTGDSGKTVYFCIRYENGKGDVGPWGPMFFAVIP
jgi:hypothetical protein